MLIGWLVFAGMVLVAGGGIVYLVRGQVKVGQPDPDEERILEYHRKVWGCAHAEDEDEEAR